MRNPTRLFVAIAFVMVGCLLSCANGSSGSDDAASSGVTTSSGKLGFMNISNARSLYIAPASSSSSSRSVSVDSSANKLFKITAEGYREEVTYKDSAGNDIGFTQTLVLQKITTLNSDYIIVSFSPYGSYYYGNYDNYLVNVTSGACYKYTEEFNPNNIGGVTYEDKYGNLYFLNISTASGRSRYSVIKLSLSNPENVSVSVYSSMETWLTTVGIQSPVFFGSESIPAAMNLCKKRVPPMMTFYSGLTLTDRFITTTAESNGAPVFRTLQTPNRTDISSSLIIRSLFTSAFPCIRQIVFFICLYFPLRASRAKK